MNKKRRLIVRSTVLSAIAAALLYTFYMNFFSEQEVVAEGDQAINFVLQNLEGERVELADYEGQGVFLNFWGTFCPPCEREMPYMENQYQVFKDQGVEILAVNVNESELVVQRFVSRHNLTFPILLDKGNNIVDAYGIGPLPSTLLIDENGTVVGKHVGQMTEDMVAEFMEKIKPEQ